MPTRTVKVNIANGLHMRPATEVVRAASASSSSVSLYKSGIEADAKSITSLLMLSAKEGSEISITSENSETIEKIANILEKKDF